MINKVKIVFSLLVVLLTALFGVARIKFEYQSELPPSPEKKTPKYSAEKLRIKKKKNLKITCFI